MRRAQIQKQDAMKTRPYLYLMPSLPISEYDKIVDDAKKAFVVPPLVINTDNYTLSSGWKTEQIGNKAMLEIRNKLKKAYPENFNIAEQCASKIMSERYMSASGGFGLGGPQWESYKSRYAEGLILIEKCLIDMERDKFIYNYLKKSLEDKKLANQKSLEDKKLANQKLLEEEKLSGPLINLRTPTALNRNVNLITFPSRNEELKGLYGGRRTYRKSKVKKVKNRKSRVRK
jgi:hypothetical protein